MVSNRIDNTFILKLQKAEILINRLHWFLLPIVKFFNKHNKYLKLKYRDDNINRYFGLKYNPLFDYHENLIDGNMINIEQAINIYHLLCRVLALNIPGDIVELGCFKGSTAIMMQKTLDQYKSKKEIYLYDAFMGLPKKQKEDGDTYFKEGFCKTTKEDLIKNYKKFKVKVPYIHEGWFNDTLPTQLPDKICFVHLDVDFYSSTIEGLKYIYPKLSNGAIVVIDDYCDPKIHNVHNVLPGVKKACDEFFRNKKEKMNVLISGSQSHGYFVKE